VLVRLSRYGGFRPTARPRDDLADALVAVLVGFLAAAVILGLLGRLGPDMGWRELVGKVSLQAVPTSLGAMLARNQLGSSGARRDRESGETTYLGELFLMA